MQKHEKILRSIREGTTIFDMFRMGYKPGEIKKASIKSLDPFFENKGMLEQFAISLISEVINLSKLQQQESLIRNVKECISVYRSAKKANSVRCFDSFANWQAKISQSAFKFWSVYHLEVDKNTLNIQDFAHECFRNIGEIIEALSKPYLKLLLQQSDIRSGKSSSFSTIDKLDLGKIIDRLLKVGNLSSLLTVSPSNIKLNQWRNIAYHHSFQVENDVIICCYKKASNIAEYRATRSELMQILQSVFNIFRVLKFSHTLFYVDNLEYISKVSRFDYREPEESSFLDFSMSVASQGFEILEYVKNQEEARIVVKDVSNLDPTKRRYHASQFVFPLWLHTNSNKLVVEYREKDGTPSFIASTDSVTCERIAKSELEIAALAEIIDLFDLKTNKVIDH